MPTAFATEKVLRSVATPVDDNLLEDDGRIEGAELKVKTSVGTATHRKRDLLLDDSARHDGIVVRVDISVFLVHIAIVVDLH